MDSKSAFNLGGSDHINPEFVIPGQKKNTEGSETHTDLNSGLWKGKTGRML